MGVSYERKLKGITVVDATGRVLGKVKDCDVDPHVWRLDSVRVELRADVADLLGAQRSFFRAAEIDVPSGLIQGIADALLLRVTARDLHSEAHTTEVPAPH